MDILNKIIKLIGTYPLLATTLSLATLGIIAVAVKSKHPVTNPPLPTPSDGVGSVFMKLKAIQLLPENPEMEVQLIAFVNGMEFHYPSADKSKWISMANNMSEVTIELPNAELYRVHLAIHFRSGETLEGGPTMVRRALLQAPGPAIPGTMPVSSLKQDYPLYLLEDGLRDTSIKAIIPYEFYIR